MCAMFSASRRLSLWSLRWLSTALSIWLGWSLMMACCSVSFMICGKRVSRFLAVRSLESFTPSWVKAGRFSCLTRMPAITSGPIAHPLPASSMPAISVLGCSSVVLGYWFLC